jgi:hypothetical protein
MKGAYWLILVFGVAASVPAWADRADWEAWVYEEAKTSPMFHSQKVPLGLMETGSVAAMIQFGYAYCQQRDKSLHAPQKDEQVVNRLEPDLLSKVPQLDTPEGVQFVDVLAAQAQRFMCP